MICWTPTRTGFGTTSATPERAAKTVEVYRDSLGPVLAVIGRIPLRDLTVQDVRSALAKKAVTLRFGSSGRRSLCLLYKALA